MRGTVKLAAAVAGVALPAVLIAAPAQAEAPKGDGVTTQHYACNSSVVPPNLDPISSITGGTSGARIRTGSSTSCTAVGTIEPSHRLDFYCYTNGNDGATWTYLRNLSTSRQGWVRDDLLPNRGSFYHCPN
ncbi:SH3 domain-containing protein [Saccharothrix syringae]|uniref:SH3 domain-containing protein n=1 Tax=Saccharothrix syringae TaxID=103733 RepID=A0A5Q0H5S8_SACSY|nr:SH3 domain-containing protein [Saccharothrix syringae]QFZ21304.1 SH3 domain-containing protein [Saccharothrix syringae]